MTDTLVSQSPVSQSPPAPQPAWGVELFGEYEGSGFKETPYLARRADGQVIRLSHLLYLVAAEADGQRSFAEIASRVSEEFGRAVSADNVRLLVEKVLRPAGVIAGEDGTVPENLSRANPLLALRLRVGLMPARAVRAITTIFWPLFLTPVMIAMLVGLVAVDVWLFFNHGLLQSVQQLLYQPSLIFVLFVLETLAAGFHECGHASACRYGGARPGVLGAGIYIVWFVFYSDVTDTYRLNKAGRLRTDLGGVYFDAIFSLAMAGAYFLTGFEPLLVLVFFNQLGALDEFTPFARFDGYYVISDLTGVPDLFGRIKPILLSLIPGRPASERVTELKPWARAVVTVWVLMTVPFLLVGLVVLIIFGPGMLSEAWRSVLMQSGMISRALEAGSITDLVAGLIQVGALIAPVVGSTFFAVLLVRRLGRGLIARYGGATAWSGSARGGTEGRRPLVRAWLLVTPVVAAAAAGIVLFLWSPLGDDFGPIKQVERATLRGGVALADPEIADRPAQDSEAFPSGGKVTPEGADREGADREDANSNSSGGVGAGEPAGTEDRSDTGQAPARNAAAPPEPAPQQVSPRHSSRQEPSPQQPAPKQFAPQQPAPEQLSPQQPAPEQLAPEQFAPQQPAPKQFAPQQPAPKQPAPKQLAPQQPAPKQFAPQQPASEQL